MKLRLSLIALTAFCAQNINAETTVTINTEKVDEEIKKELEKEVQQDVSELKRKYEGVEGLSIEESDKGSCCKPRPCCNKPCNPCCKDIEIEAEDVDKCGCSKPRPKTRDAEVAE